MTYNTDFMPPMFFIMTPATFLMTPATFLMTPATFLMASTDAEGHLPDAYRPKRASVSFGTSIRALRYEHPRLTLRAAIHDSHSRQDDGARAWDDEASAWDDEKIGK